VQKSLKKFLSLETASGLLMLLAAVFALMMVNCPLTTPFYHSFKAMPLGLTLGSFSLSFSLETFVKDGLMTLFFLMVGLELKKEMLEGQLAHKGQKILPLIAAFGGTICPALLYLAFTFYNPEMSKGWGVPTATDIAFALAVLLVIKKHLPASSRLFLMAVAVYDDLIAIAIIALFYGGGFHLKGVLASLGVCGILWLMNRVNILPTLPYMIVGSILAFTLHEAGIHMTIAGVITAMAIPLRSLKNPSHSPVSLLIHKLHPIVSYGIVPLFAFLSSGVYLGEFSSEKSLAIALITGGSLWIGKQIGIWSFTMLSAYFKIAPLPHKMTSFDVYVVACLAGVGFTMSLFVASLAFQDHSLHEGAILGTLGGSLLAALWGIGMTLLKKKH
jgi:Na+:H+ antiporter, NhaA family